MFELVGVSTVAQMEKEKENLPLTYAFVTSSLVQTLSTYILIFDFVQTSYYLLEKGAKDSQRLACSTRKQRTSVETWRLRLMIQTLSTGSPCAFCGGTVDDSFRLDLRAEEAVAGLGACSTPSIGTGALLLLPLDIVYSCMIWMTGFGC